MQKNAFPGKMLRFGMLCVMLLAVAASGGCAWFQDEYAGVRAQLMNEPENAAPLTDTAPTLLTLSASPNPVAAGKMVILTAKYDDLEADLQQGLAAVSINGAEPITLAFRTVYPSGLLTLSVPISSYARASSLRMRLKIRDDAGNWSNSVATVVTVE